MQHNRRPVLDIFEGKITILDQEDNEILSWDESEWKKNSSVVIDMMNALDLAFRKGTDYLTAKLKAEQLYGENTVTARYMRKREEEERDNNTIKILNADRLFTRISMVLSSPQHIEQIENILIDNGYVQIIFEAYTRDNHESDFVQFLGENVHYGLLNEQLKTVFMEFSIPDAILEMKNSMLVIRLWDVTIPQQSDIFCFDDFPGLNDEPIKFTRLSDL